MTPEKILEQTIKTIQANIKDKRSELGITQEELAKICGMKRQDIGFIESKSKNVMLKTLIKIANALRIDLIDLISKQ